MSALLQKSSIDQISIEGKQGNIDPAVLKNLGDKTVILGCVDVGDENVEKVEDIVGQAKAALEFIKPEQLILGPDCGLVQISREAAKNKLKELVDLAGINQQNNGRAEQTDRATNTLRAIKSLAICIRDCSQYTGS